LHFDLSNIYPATQDAQSPPQTLSILIDGMGIHGNDMTPVFVDADQFFASQVRLSNANA